MNSKCFEFVFTTLISVLVGCYPAVDIYHDYGSPVADWSSATPPTFSAAKVGRCFRLPLHKSVAPKAEHFRFIPRTPH